MDRIRKIASLRVLVERFSAFEKSGQLSKASEETMRSWINELLLVFGWDVKNTNEVQQEVSLSKNERVHLPEIGSHNTRPDYTLVNGKLKLAFIDAKDLDICIERDRTAAFQIRSYGWSISAKFSILTNFRELAIYDCTIKPKIDDPASFARIHHFTSDQYVEHFDLLARFLERTTVIEGCFDPIVNRNSVSLDVDFAKSLCDFRIHLAEAILTRNGPVVNIETLGMWCQIIINRILFIRVCETRQLETPDLLLQFESRGFWESFKHSSYFDFHTHYDGPLFQRVKHIQGLLLDDDVFSELLRLLYYPSPYRFDVIPTSTLSDIYDLFLSYELKIVDGVIINELRSEFKKSNGAVTTPSDIVQNVVGSLFNPKIERLLSHELLNLKFLDPACGSGVFLVAIYDRLSNLYLQALVREKESSSYIITNNGPELTIEGRKAIINNCLFGVDINPEAVEVAKMSLSLKVIDDYHPNCYEQVGLFGRYVLSRVGENLRCGNTLVDNDITDLFPSIQDRVPELHKTRMFSWEDEFPTVMDNGGFDFVVGNPPYVEVKNYNTELPTMSLYIKSTYKSCKNGKIDLSIPFIERGLSLLNERGMLSFIVQKRFFKTEYGKGIRKLLTDNNLIASIYDYSETDLFVGRTTYVAILVCDKSRESASPVRYQLSASSEVTLLPSESLSAAPWSFENPEISGLRTVLTTRLSTIGKMCSVKVGIQVLWDKAYHIVVDRISDGVLYGHSGIDDSVAVELDACRPLVCNEHFQALSRISFSTYAIFPYEVSNGKSTPILFDDFCKKYPRAGAYLSKHRKEIIESVEVLPLRDPCHTMSTGWHLYTRANNHAATTRKFACR